MDIQFFSNHLESTSVLSSHRPSCIHSYSTLIHSFFSYHFIPLLVMSLYLTSITLPSLLVLIVWFEFLLLIYPLPQTLLSTHGCWQPTRIPCLVAEMENLKSKFASLELVNQRLLVDLQKVSVEKQKIHDDFTRRFQQLESAIVALQQLKVDV